MKTILSGLGALIAVVAMGGALILSRPASPGPLVGADANPSATAGPSATAAASPTASATAVATATATPSSSTSPTVAPTPEPTASQTPEPTASQTPEPTASPTTEPTASPTTEPTSAPVLSATRKGSATLGPFRITGPAWTFCWSYSGTNVGAGATTPYPFGITIFKGSLDSTVNGAPAIEAAKGCYPSAIPGPGTFYLAVNADAPFTVTVRQP